MEEYVNSKCGLCVAHTLHDVYSFIKDLQHRGRDACGIAAIGDRIDIMKWAGAVGNVDLGDLHKIFPAEQYHTYMAHVRYKTRGREAKLLEDTHPHAIGGRVIAHENHLIIRNCDAAAVHNGEADMEPFYGARAKHSCDTPLLLDYYWQNGAHQLMRNIPGSYFLALADRDNVLVMRDRFGVKPGCMGLKDGKYCAASESVAFKNNGAIFIEDIEPGTIYYLSPKGRFKKERVFSEQPQHCKFDWQYISHLESILDGIPVRNLRREAGIELAREYKPDVDVVTYLPRCPETTARSYCKERGIESSFMDVFYKLKSERAFQGANQEDRDNSISSNLHLLPRMEDILRDKRVLVIDDSTIRGTNARHAKKLLDLCEVKSVCYGNYTAQIGIIGDDGIPRGCMFGVDMPPTDNFIVRAMNKPRNRTNKEINRSLGMEVYFLSREGEFRSFERAGIKREHLCSFCVGGKHPFK